MPRTCSCCKNPDREKIDAALVAGESFRQIAERYALSVTAVFRHKTHVGQAIVKAVERREEQIGDNTYDEMRRLQRKAWELLGKMEAQGDHRGSIVAVREGRECLESLGAMLEKAGGGQGEIRVVVEHVGARSWQEKPRDEGKELPAITIVPTVTEQTETPAPAAEPVPAVEQAASVPDASVKKLQPIRFGRKFLAARGRGR